MHEVKGTHATKKITGGYIMSTVYHAGFMTYLLIAVIAFLALSFVAPDTAHQVLVNLHNLALAVKV